MSFCNSYTLRACFRTILHTTRLQPQYAYRNRIRLASSFTSVTIDDSGLATLTMKRPPVNSLNLTLMQEITENVKEMEKTKGCRGFILTSDMPKVFSAGLDIAQLHQPKTDELRTFWYTLQEMWLSLFGTKLATVAAINGHAPAGGCLMALCCDYRVMVRQRITIGLNEVLLGIVPPPWLQDTMQHTIGSRQAERALSLGTLFDPEDALKHGVVDEVMTSSEEVLERAEEELGRLAAIPEHARQATKAYQRQTVLRKFHENRLQDVENYVHAISSDRTQKVIQSYFDAIKKKQRSQ